MILGNSGSGKTTLARRLAVRHGVPCLDLDTVAWEPGRIAVPREPGAARDEVRRFCEASEGWVVEGCYAGYEGPKRHVTTRDAGSARTGDFFGSGSGE